MSVPHIVESARAHQHPTFAEASQQATSAARAKLSLKQQFKHYARLLCPFVDARDQKDINRAIVWATVGTAMAINPVLERFQMATNPVLERFQIAAPWLFAISAALVTRRMAVNALSHKARKVFNVVTQGLFAFGPALFACGFGAHMVNDWRETGHLSWNDEMSDNIGGLVTAALVLKIYFKKTAQALSMLQPDKPKKLAAQPDTYDTFLVGATPHDITVAARPAPYDPFLITAMSNGRHLPHYRQGPLSGKVTHAVLSANSYH